MRLFLAKLYHLMTEPLYRRLFNDLTNQYQHVLYEHIQFQERFSSLIVEELLRLSLVLESQTLVLERYRELTEEDLKALLTERKDIQLQLLDLVNALANDRESVQLITARGWPILSSIKAMVRERADYTDLQKELGSLKRQLAELRTESLLKAAHEDQRPLNQ